MQKLTHLRGNDSCSSGRTCPAVKRTEGGSLVIVGAVITDPAILAQLGIGPGETAIEIPGGLIPELADDAA